jgi:hypothetical protein
MGLNSVEEIKDAINRVTPKDVDELCEWLCDRRIESDLAAGRLDSAIERALHDEKNGRVQPL